MKLKLDDAGHAVLQDGKPVYVYPDGKEVAFDAPGTVATITRINAEAKTNRERAEVAEGAMKGFDGLDAEAARKALALTANMDAKKLIDAGEVEKVKGEITKVFTEKLTAAEKRASDMESALYGEKIGGAFSRSKFVADKIAVPADMLQNTFGKAFKIEDGKVAAYDQNGSKIYSRAKPGELAEFEEALEILVDGYAYKDSILKGNQNGGGGTRQSQGAGARSITRAQFDAMPPADQLKAVTVDKIAITD